jgi:hypothetical protein
MSERRTIEREKCAGRTDLNAAKRSRLSLNWYLDPVTAKPAARWVLDAPETTANQELAAAA